MAAANLYYNQPLLGDIGQELGATGSGLGWVPTMTQVGYAAGMLLIVPLGDSLERRRIIVTPQIFTVSGVSMGVNYGCGKVRFPSPVPVGSKLRLGVTLVGIEEIAGGAQVTQEFVFEIEGASKPSCVAEVIFRYYV
jgi:acyl dehydratase